MLQPSLKPENLSTDPIELDIGPFHWSVNGPMRFRLVMDGETIVRARIETGFAHRSIEKICENRPWNSLCVLADRVDPEAAVFYEHALCMAIEEIGEILVPKRAQAIRVMVSELSRVSSHMAYIVRVARAVGAEAVLHYILRDREKILDLFELLSGARFTLNFLRIGGVSADVSEGFVERTIDVCELIRSRLKEYNDLFSYNQAFLDRAAFLGVVVPEQAREVGLTGPNARASGLRFDARADASYAGYDRMDLRVNVGKGESGVPGDAHDRYLIRLREISQSLDLVKSVIDTLPGGDFQAVRLDPDFRLPVGEAYSRVEGPRGLIGCHVVSDGGVFPCRVQFRAPSVAALSLLPELLVGVQVSDLPLLVASLDICISEVDL